MTQGDGRRWFLLVEDNEDEERLATRAANRAGIDCEVRVARDGEEAERVLSGAAGDPPAFVLLDIKLPKVNGLEVLQWMRSQPHFSGVPAIVLVGASGSVDLNEIYRMGANSLVRKELDYEVYMARMVPAIKYWCEVNTVPKSKGP